MTMDSSLLISPKVAPSLDSAFRPGVLAHRHFEKAVGDCPDPVQITIGLEQADGSIFHHQLSVFPEHHPLAQTNFFFLERLVKFLLWARGGFRIYLDGPAKLGEKLQQHYAQSATGRFDAEVMGERIYERKFEVILTHDLPPARAATKPLGRHLDGCRIGFDLGGSDRKIAAVMDGQCVFSDEITWDPVPQRDPQWHFDQVMESLKEAAQHLPRVDAIGGSSAGVIVNSRVKVASLFRGVSPELFHARVKDIFLNMKRAWGSIPFEVVNDGEVTALAGSMAINKNAVLGIAMGTSMAGGYVTPEGNITSWLNELAFAPIDYNPAAPVDEWSGDFGCGVQYFSQQAVGRLLRPAGIDVEPTLSLPEKLKHVQALMEHEDPRAARIYQSIGVYLGYALGHFSTFYDIENFLLLGRVTSGPGGRIINQTAQEVLAIEFPELHHRVIFHMPGEKEKRHGQAIAAASLPQLNSAT